MLANASILITGGTGSLGKAFVDTVLKRHPDIKRLVIFSRDELKQFEMSQIWSEKQYKGLRYFLGVTHLDMGFVRHALGTYGEDIVSLAAQDYFFDKSPLRRAFFENAISGHASEGWLWITRSYN